MAAEEPAKMFEMLVLYHHPGLITAKSEIKAWNRHY